MRLFNCSPLWAANRLARNLCTPASWGTLLLPAMFWFGISSGAGMSTFREAVTRLARTGTAATSPRLVMSRKGDALALWCEGAFGSQSLWGNRYAPGAGWDKPQHLGTRDGDEGEARAALNARGEATLLWIQTLNRTRHLLAATYRPGRGWGSPAVLDSTGLALSPQVLLDESGNSLATWHRYETADHSYHFLCARRTPAGWTSPSVIGTDQVVPTAAISGNGSGRAVALWNAAAAGARVGQVRHNTWARLFDPVDGWGGAVPLGREIVQDDRQPGAETAQSIPGHHAPIVAMDDLGNALALWQEVSAPGRNYHLKGVRFDREKGWGSPDEIAENPLSVSAALSEAGIAFVCLTQGAQWPEVDAYLSSLTVATHMGVGWFSEKVLDNYPYFCLNPTLLLGSDGQPLVTWVKGAGEGRELWAATRTVSGWISTVRLDEEGAVEQYEAGWDEDGNAIVVWTENGGAGSSVWGRKVQI